MAFAVDRLPSDPERLRAIIVEQAAARAAKEAELHACDLLVEKLKAQLAVLRQAPFGWSSEKLERSIAQLKLALEEIETSGAAASVEAPGRSDPPTRRLRPVRTPLPDHLPLHRQSEIYARESVEIARSPMADWVGRSAVLMEPLVAALRRHVLSGERLHGDDTPVPVLDPGCGRARQGRLWVYVRDGRPRGETAPPSAFYKYGPDRKGEHLQAHLKDFRGVLQADGYAGFNELYVPTDSEGPHIHEAACWAHVRRKFFDIHASNASPLAAEALSRIGALYDIEAGIRGRPPDARRLVRAGESEPRLTASSPGWRTDCAGCRARVRLPGRSAMPCRVG